MTVHQALRRQQNQHLDKLQLRSPPWPSSSRWRPPALPSCEHELSLRQMTPSWVLVCELWSPKVISQRHSMRCRHATAAARGLGPSRRDALGREPAARSPHQSASLGAKKQGIISLPAPDRRPVSRHGRLRSSLQAQRAGIVPRSNRLSHEAPVCGRNIAPVPHGRERGVQKAQYLLLSTPDTAGFPIELSCVSFEISRATVPRPLPGSRPGRCGMRRAINIAYCPVQIPVGDGRSSNRLDSSFDTCVSTSPEIRRLHASYNTCRCLRGPAGKLLLPPPVPTDWVDTTSSCTSVPRKVASCTRKRAQRRVNPVDAPPDRPRARHPSPEVGPHVYYACHTS